MSSSDNDAAGLTTNTRATSDKKPTTVSLPVATSNANDDLWYSAGLSFECTQCGNCCSGTPGYVWISLEDIARMAAFKNMPVDDFTMEYVRIVQGAISLKEKRDYDCVFLKRESGKATCSIYPVRPGQCRTWPFWNQNLNSPQAWEDASRTCPGMKNKTAKVYPVDHIETNRLNPDSP